MPIKKVYTSKDNVNVYEEIEGNSVIGHSTSLIIEGSIELNVLWTDHHFYEVDDDAIKGKKVICTGASGHFEKDGKQISYNDLPLTVQPNLEFYRVKQLLALLEYCYSNNIKFQDRTDHGVKKRLLQFIHDKSLSLRIAQAIKKLDLK